MSVEIRDEDDRSLATYAAISCAYEVRAAIDPIISGRWLPSLQRRDVTPTFRKDYDAIPGNHPRDWPAQFDVHRARFLGAYSGGHRVGGAVVVVDQSDVARLGGSDGAALLWDLRVTPTARGHGAGLALLTAAEASAQIAGATSLEIETQNINVAACELYHRAGYVITTIDPHAYDALPNEIQIRWTKAFEAGAPSG